MGLRVPELDDRTYAELLEDVRKRIPVLAPSWTDHNAHDPGVTLLETLAWVAEAYRYRLDRVTDDHRRTYLALLGETPRGPASATALVRVEGASGGPLPPGLDGLTVPAGTGLVADDGEGERRFETTRAATLSTASIATVHVLDRGGTADATAAVRRPGTRVAAFGPGAAVGGCLLVGLRGDPFAEADAFDLAVRLADEAPAPESDWPGESSPGPDVRLEWAYYAAPDAPAGPGPEPEPSNGDDDVGTGDEPTGRGAKEEGSDEASEAGEDGQTSEPGRGRWRPLPVVADGTRRFTRSGRVRLGRPADWRPGTWTPPDGLDGLDGADGPPGDASEAEGAATALVGIRCVVAAGEFETPPLVDALDSNVLEVEHRATRRRETLRGPDGTVETTALPNQWFAFAHAPVLSADVVLVPADVTDGDGPDDVDGRSRNGGDGEDPAPGADGETDADADAGPGERWTAVPDLDASGPDDRHYVLDATAGTLRFGDGVRGRVPPAGRRVVARQYVHGGGTAGNVPVDASWRVLAPAEEATGEARAGGDGDVGKGDWRESVSVRALGPATGGRDAESVDEALARVRAGLRVPHRAVSLADARSLAEHTPGVRVARAAATLRPGVGPDGADVVRVTAVPYARRGRPRPTAGFIQAVRRHLDRHRLLTDRVEVVAPTYVGVGVDVVVRVVPGYSPEGRRRAVANALDAFLDPLTGFEGEGWPFGRPVYRSELYAAVEAVSGVDWVVDLGVRADGEVEVDAEGNLVVGEAALVHPTTHRVTVRTDLPGGDP